MSPSPWKSAISDCACDQARLTIAKTHPSPPSPTAAGVEDVGKVIRRGVWWKGVRQAIWTQSYAVNTVVAPSGWRRTTFRCCWDD